MQEAAHWIAWRPVPDRNNPTKINKIPIDPFTNQPFEKDSGWQTNPARWARFEQLNGQPKGFMLGGGWAGIDLDDCVVEGKVAPWVIAIVQEFGIYAEISPSGTGVKLFMRGTRPDGAEGVKTCPAWNWEIYADNRYFTVTGNKLPEAPNEILDRTAHLQRLTELVWGDDLVALCRLRGLYRSERGDTVNIHCPWDSEHSGGSTETSTGLQIKDGQVVGFHCFHAHCRERTIRDFRKWFGISSALDHPLTEAGDAECFADLYQDLVRFDHHRGRWLVTDEVSGIWIPDPVERLTQMAVEAMRFRQRQANAIERIDERKAAWAWAIKGESRGRITNTLALARSVPPLNDEGLNWDQNPFLLGVQNGVIDLQTSQFRKATAADRVTMRVRVPYDPTATCPLWTRTISEIFAPTDLLTSDESQELINFVQRAVGYSITGDCREECCFFLWGGGGNGKGTLVNILGWLFADYTDDMPYSTLEKSVHGSGIPSDIAKLEGKRFITCAEVNEFTLNETRLKALTGRDPLTARFLHHEWFTFIPVGKIWIATNNKPKIIGTDDGIWRRIHLIPFLQEFVGRENKQLKDQLRLELAGILNWVLAGTQLWLRDGLNQPAIVRAATAKYRLESNPITPFIEKCCVEGANLRLQAAPAFAAYMKFANDSNIEPWARLSDKAFHKAMKLAFKWEQKQRQTFYCGVGLQQSGDEHVAGDENRGAGL
jgi:P4 family phage/plasmid primase-like protien